MKMFVVICALVAAASCAPSVDPEIAARRALPALEHEEIHDEFGQYALRYVTAEGTVVSERGRLVPTAKGDYVLVTEGEISYIGDDGELYITKFTAGLDGYHVETNHQPMSNIPESADASAQ
ncbi:uncharacterized protein LOC110994688 [Pieris rapae]|uniref:uncharacterized protein LOC110994688 n=1 Tax=Pieris rapae TaxID=64459 RepID=UPI001E27D219|nr:uncharacterized protein LOC110994688 [Pieris rapae]